MWPHCEVANVQDCDIIVSEFELQSRDYVHFRANIIWKSMNILIPASNGLIETQI